MRKKFLFALAFLLTLSFCVSAFGATTLVVKTGGTLTFDNLELTEEKDTEEDENGEEIEVVTKVTYTLSKGNYEFSSIADALDFVSRKEGYLEGKFYPSSTAPEEEYSIGDVDLTDIEIKLEDAILGNSKGITIDNSDLKKIVINGNKKTISDSSVSERYFTLTGGTEFEMKDLTLNGGGSVGGIEIQSGFTSTATFNNVTFQNLSADNGGAMYVAGGTLAFSGTNTFTENSATNGGAVYIASTTPEFSNVVFSKNTATNGGAVYVQTGGATFSSSASFTDNNTANLGGALYVSNGTVGVSTKISGGVAETNGGAIYIANGTVNINDSLKGNTASTNGGAIYIAENGIVNINSGTISDNEAEQNGGAVYIANSRRAKLNINSEIYFEGNKAASNGGAIYVACTNDPAIVLNSSASLNFTDNSVDNGNGGALWLATSSQLPTGTITFDTNHAYNPDSSNVNAQTNGNGGAIYIDGTSAVTFGSSQNYKFTGNTADCYGGAIYTSLADITFDGFVADTQNTASIGGGFASSGSGAITIQNGSSISKQKATSGGAIYGGIITVNNSDFIDNESNGENTSDGGGAIYAKGKLTLDSALFKGNKSTEEGGAVYVYMETGGEDTVSIKNSYFSGNSAKNGNGGAVNLSGASASTITRSTFENHECGADGGAVYVTGDRPDISYCYFVGNHSNNRGGAIYFNQTGSSSLVFQMTYTMLRKNSASGTNQALGGGVCVIANGATIDSCTFDGNFINTAQSEAFGGGLYLSTIINETRSNTIDNCTFVDNSVAGTNPDTSCGGAFYVQCQQTTMRSCTLTGNEAYKGGAVYISQGRFTISGTIAVGNTSTGNPAADLWVVPTAQIASRGYNRIGYFANTSNGTTDFYSVGRQETDRTAFPNKGWTRRTFFDTAAKNPLAPNERTDLSDSIPPYIGSGFGENRVEVEQRLETLMLSEDVTLPIEDRATNVIPYPQFLQLPKLDERGVDRQAYGNSVKVDIGAVWYDQTIQSDSDTETAKYSIRAIQISGLPNYLRQPGTTVKLTAKIYYTNGRANYGGNGTAEEAVKWSVSGVGAGYVKIDSATGVLTVTNVATRPISTIIKVESVRTDISGNPAASAIKYVMLGGREGDSLNTANGYNTDNDYLMRELIYSFEEYDIGYGYFNDADATLQSIQEIMAEFYGLNSASLVTDLSASTLDLISPSTFNSSEGFSPLEGTGVTISLKNVSEGEILPVPYPCNLPGSVLREILGSDVYNSLASDLFVASQNDSTVSDETAQKIFSNLRLDFQDKNGNVWPLVGSDSNIDLIDALDCGALVLSSDNDYSGGIHFTLNSCLINAEAVDTEYEGPQLVGTEGEELLMLPDGVTDDEIYGTLWVSRKDLQNSSTSSNSKTQNNSSSKTSSNSSSESESLSGGSSGGCEILNLGLIAAVLILILKRK